MTLKQESEHLTNGPSLKWQTDNIQLKQTRNSNDFCRRLIVGLNIASTIPKDSAQRTTTTPESGFRFTIGAGSAISRSRLREKWNCIANHDADGFHRRRQLHLREKNPEGKNRRPQSTLSSPSNPSMSYGSGITRYFSAFVQQNGNSSENPAFLKSHRNRLSHGDIQT